jgi:hypothetical protein
MLSHPLGRHTIGGTKATNNHLEPGSTLMKTSIQTNHHTLVEELRRRVLEGPGETMASNGLLTS